MKKNATKRALLTSVISLLLCVSMLVGTTFAWFTDSVTSANNIIQSGNLDVEMYYQVEGQSDWTKVTSETNVFMENALWEPGHTEVVKLKIVNEGSLALKYNLGVNIVSETASVNQKGDVFRLSEYIKFGVVAGAQTYTREQAVAAVDATATPLKTAYNSGVTELAAGGEKIVTMVVYMPTSVGNEANHAKGAAQPTINLGINLFATQLTAESDSFNNQYDKNAIIVTTAEEAQAALDNATADTTIQLVPGVDYGTLYLRPYAGGAATKNVDWIGNNYGWETYTLFENVTIIGAASATIDAIEIEGGTYYHTEHSQDEQYPVMLSLVELKNVVIDGVTFTGKGGYDPQGYGNVINLSGGNIKVDGLTLKNCVLNNSENNARLIYKTEATTNVHTFTYGGETFTFSPTLKDITVTGCTFNGGYMGLELRETENLTITNNVFNVADRNILLPVNTGCTYTGNITITGNVSNNAQERFVRGDGMGDAVVVIKDNTLNNYMGEDPDYIKVTNGNNVTIENNTMTRAYKAATVDELKAALNAAQAGETVILAADITLTSDIAISNANFVLDGNGHTITGTSTYGLFDITGGTVALKNVNFVGVNGPVIRTVGVKFNATNVVVKESSSAKQQGLFRLFGENTITNCTFKDNTCNMVITLNYDGENNDPQIIEKCVFEGNTCNDTAVVYYVTGAGASINNNKFIGNSVNSNGHAAVLYCEEATIMGNEFTGNDVNAAGKRVGVIVLDAGVVSDNVFSGNAIATTASESYKATIVSKGDVGTELVLSNNTATDYANVKGNTITVA